MKEKKTPLILKHIVWLNVAWQWRYHTDNTGFRFIGTHCILVGLVLAVCAMVFNGQVFLVLTTTGVSCYNFHGASCYIVTVIQWVITLAWNATKLQFIYFLLRNTPYLCIVTRQRGSNCFFITAVKINVHNFHLPLTRAQTNTMAHAYIHLHTHAYIHVNIVPCLPGPNCRESTVYIRCNNLPPGGITTCPGLGVSCYTFLVCLLRNFKTFTDLL